MCRGPSTAQAAPLLALLALASCEAVSGSNPAAPADREAAGRRPAEDGASGIDWQLESGFGAEAAWVRPHLEASARVLIRLLGSEQRPPPVRIAVTLEHDPEADTLSGWATSEGVGFRSDQWPEDSWRLWITTHELTNLLAAHYACGGGFPSDWWSNGRSPFPVYVTGLVLQELDHPEVAAWLRASNASQPDHELYWHLHERHGFELFADALAMLRHDGVDLGEIEPPWPWPSARRSTYTVAYLSLAAGEDLTATVASFGVGREPPDWRDNHLQIPFEEYTLDPAEVAAVMREREQLFGAGGAALSPVGVRVARGSSEELERARERFRAGR
jgi:hypothetical protein